MISAKQNTATAKHRKVIATTHLDLAAIVFGRGGKRGYVIEVIANVEHFSNLLAKLLVKAIVTPRKLES